MIKSELVDRISVQNPLLYGRGETCAAHRLCQSARDVMVARTRCSNNEQQIGKVCKRSRRRFFFIRTATRGAMMVLCAHALASFLGLWSVASFCDRTLKAPARGSTDAEFQTPPERLSSIPQVRIEASE